MEKYKVFDGERFLGETVAKSPEQACSMVRMRVMGMVRHSDLNLVAMVQPKTIEVDVQILPCSPSARCFYPGARRGRAKAFLKR